MNHIDTLATLRAVTIKFTEQPHVFLERFLLLTVFGLKTLAEHPDLAAYYVALDDADTEPKFTNAGKNLLAALGFHESFSVERVNWNGLWVRRAELKSVRKTKLLSADYDVGGCKGGLESFTKAAIAFEEV